MTMSKWMLVATGAAAAVIAAVFALTMSDEEFARTFAELDPLL
jgi:hypothetical protein